MSAPELSHYPEARGIVAAMMDVRVPYSVDDHLASGDHEDAVAVADAFHALRRTGFVRQIETVKGKDVFVLTVAALEAGELFSRDG